MVASSELLSLPGVKCADPVARVDPKAISVDEARSLGRILVHWKLQIDAWHEARVTNGPTEAANNLIKGVKRRIILATPEGDELVLATTLVKFQVGYLHSPEEIGQVSAGENGHNNPS
jgi:hypothetical protein